MEAILIDGKQAAAEVKEGLAAEVREMAERGVVPGLTVILVGNNPASQVYVRNKARECEKIGIRSEVIRLPEETGQDELLRLIGELNLRDDVHGILVQLPLPAHISEEAVLLAIDPAKDVDGFHPVNVGNLAVGREAFLPCTPAGCIELIKRTGVSIAGKHAVVIGRSNIVGKPMALLLLREHATVTICHSRTAEPEKIVRQADIVVAAAGRAKLVKKDWIKPGAVVIDVGINRMEDGTLAGDVDFAEARGTAGYLTPVPGGVGPMTIAFLLKNTVRAAKLASGAW